MRFFQSMCFLFLAGAPVHAADDKGTSATSQVLVEGSGWEQIWKDTHRAKFLAANNTGVVMASLRYEGDGPLDDIAPESILIRFPVVGAPDKFCELGSDSSGLAFGPDGRLYVYSEDERFTVVDGKGAEWNATKHGQTLGRLSGFCMDASGRFFATSIYDRTINWGSILPLAAGDGRTAAEPQEIKFGEISRPDARVVLSPNQKLLYATHNGSKYLQVWSVLPNGSVVKREDNYQLRADKSGQVEAAGLCVDTDGQLYVATKLGIQMIDHIGHIRGIIPTPQQPYDVCLGGRDLRELFIACGDKIYKRQTKVQGYNSGQMPPAGGEVKR